MRIHMKHAGLHLIKYHLMVSRGRLLLTILGGGGHSLIWPKWVCAAQQGMVFRVLHLKQGIQFHYLAS